MTNKEISQRLNIATSSSSYLLQRLEKEDFLSRDGATNRSKIGLRMLAIARGALRQMDFPTLAAPLLRQLAVHTGLDVVVGVLDHERLMIVARVANSEFIQAEVDAGTEFPAHATATGEALLSCLSKEEILTLTGHDRLARLTDRTITNHNQLLAELESVAANGYSRCDEELVVGRRSVGAVIPGLRRNVRGALALAGDITHPFWEKPMSEIVGIVKVTAEEISRIERYGCGTVLQRSAGQR